MSNAIKTIRYSYYWYQYQSCCTGCSKRSVWWVERCVWEGLQYSTRAVLWVDRTSSPTQLTPSVSCLTSSTTFHSTSRSLTHTFTSHSISINAILANNNLCRKPLCWCSHSWKRIIYCRGQIKRFCSNWSLACYYTFATYQILIF